MTSIAVVGNVQADVLVRPVLDLPAPGTDVLVDDIAVRAAGSAGNTALALRGLGSPARLFGNLGDDRFGQLVMAELAERRGVRIALHHMPADTKLPESPAVPPAVSPVGSSAGSPLPGSGR